MNTTTKTATVTRAKKGDGPMAIAYLNHAGEETKRVAEHTEAIKISSKDGKHKVYNINNLPPAVRNQLIILGLSKKIETNVRNGMKSDGANVLDIANATFETLKEGKLYTRKEGGKGSAGRPFDVNLWLDILLEASRIKKRSTPTEKELATYTLKLTSLPPATRKVFLAKQLEDIAFALAKKTIEAKRLAGRVKTEKSDVNGFEGLFA